MRILIIIVASYLLAACQQSPQKQYYLLSAPTETIEKTGVISQSIGLGPIKLPDYLQRPQMIRHHGDTTLDMANNHYWAERLDKGIARVLGLHLTQYDHSRIILPFPWRNDSRPSQSLRLYIHELKFINGNAKINATWELVDTVQQHKLSQQHFIRQVNAGNNAEGMAIAYSQLFAELAKEMDKALNKTHQQYKAIK